MMNRVRGNVDRILKSGKKEVTCLIEKKKWLRQSKGSRQNREGKLENYAEWEWT